ncbi:MAG: class I SAM-dependent methyltransferase [Stappiaceae bacterium]
MGHKRLTVANLKKLSSEHGPFKKVLDVGCGGRIYEKYIANNGYLGIDVEVSGHNNDDKNVDQFFDGVNIPYEDNSFDFVLCTEVLEHAVKPDDLLKEMNRVLSEDGYLYLTVPSMWGEHETPYDFRRYTTFGIKLALEYSGFEVLSLEKEEPGVDAFIRLAKSELNAHFKKEKNWKHKICTHWLKKTRKLFNYLGVEMPRIYLSNHVLAKKAV